MHSQGIAQINDLSKLRRKPTSVATRFISWQRLRFDKWNLKNGNVLRIRFRARRPKYLPVETPYPIDAEVNCTPAQAEKLHQLIESWLG